jgi:DNA polymerase III delta prime subunit
VNYTDKTLAKHLENNKVAPSYLLVDKDIIKLSKIADWFTAQYFAGANTNADTFKLVAKEGTNSIQVEQTEEFIGRVHLAAISGKKLFIISDAATMTIAAQNKILKTIEDASAGYCFLLLASSVEPILNTIRSRCVTIYTDPTETNLTEAELIANNKSSTEIFTNVEKLMFVCKSVDDALPLLKPIVQKENFDIVLLAFDKCVKKILSDIGSGKDSHFTIQRINSIIKKLATINRNVAANCNTQNALDGLVIELFKGVS